MFELDTTESTNADASNWDMPPPSQSHFSQFANFAPNDGASFEDEFSRLASSQNWVPGSQVYRRQRTIAIREELTLHYFTPPEALPASQSRQQREELSSDNEEDEEDEDEEDSTDDQSPSPLPEGAPPPSSQPRPRIRKKTRTKTKTKTQPQPPPTILTKEQRILQGYQSLCLEVGIPPHDTAKECQTHLQNTLVNIIDLIDARRVVPTDDGTGKKKVKVWDDFEAFRDYTLQPEHCISQREAKKGDGILASLLQRLRGRGKRTGKGRGKDDGAGVSKTVSGRVTKGGNRRK